MLFHRAVIFKNNERLISEQIKLSIYLIKLKTNKKLSIQLSLNIIGILKMHDLKELRVGCVLALEGKLFQRTEPRYRKLRLQALHFEFLS